ncbi:MAG: hypothetical protein Q4G18_05465, partial [Myroides sp.]|nr:hypothetical protein [Myroides sp.]
MKTLITLALLAMTTVMTAQPGHGKSHGKGHYKKHQKHQKHKAHKYQKDYKHGRKVVRNDYQRDYHYHVQREMARYDFLRLSQAQRSRLQVSLNFLISNRYAPKDYDLYLRRDLSSILSRSQYD